MAHGTPDWGLTAGTVTTYQLTDLAELAARLGSIVTFDRRGDVVLLDDFEHGLAGWQTGVDGTGAAADLSLERARSGQSSLRLKAGSDGGASANAFRPVTVVALSPLGFEGSFHLASHIDRLQFDLFYFDGSQRSQFTVRWRDTDDDLQYRDENGAYVTFATGLDLFTTNRLFHTAKLVADPETGLYSRFQLDNVSYDLSSYSGEVLSSSTAAQFYPRVWLYGRAGQNDIVYTDDVIATQNEPV